MWLVLLVLILLLWGGGLAFHVGGSLINLLLLVALLALALDIIGRRSPPL